MIVQTPLCNLSCIIYHCVVTEEQGQLHAEVHIKSTAGCVPRCCEPGSRPVLHIIVDTKYKFEAVLGQVFGQVSDTCVCTIFFCSSSRLFHRLKIGRFSGSLAELFLAPPHSLVCQWNLGQYQQWSVLASCF